jgi:hypothetical protein
VIVHFVDIGGINDHHCLNSLFIIENKTGGINSKRNEKYIILYL